MIRAVTVTNYLGESKRFELAFPDESGFAVQSISGLGPSKADINTTEISTNDGSLYNSARVNSRNIVMSLKLMFNPQIEDTRHDSYKYFPIKKKVTLLIETDNRICETYGYVESNEPDIFSSDETTQISIVCPDPYFYSAGPDGTNTTIFYGVEPLFEFAFSNESLTESLIEFGEIKNETEQTVYYSGDAEIGVVITIHAIGNVRNITIYNTGTREVMRIDTDKLKQLTGSGMVAGDEIIISTIKGDKSITLLRNGIYTNILNCLDKDSDWFQLSKGDNIFAYVVEEGTTNVQFKIETGQHLRGIVMELIVLDTSLKMLSVLDTFESLIWTERYSAYGDFEVYTSINDSVLEILKDDYYLWLKESDQTMIVEDRKIESDAENGNHFTVTGRSLESILERRIIWKQTILSGNFQNGIKKLLDENIINPSDASRKVEGLILRHPQTQRLPH